MRAPHTGRVHTENRISAEADRPGIRCSTAVRSRCGPPAGRRSLSIAMPFDAVALSPWSSPFFILEAERQCLSAAAPGRTSWRRRGVHPGCTLPRTPRRRSCDVDTWTGENAWIPVHRAHRLPALISHATLNLVDGARHHKGSLTGHGPGAPLASVFTVRNAADCTRASRSDRHRGL